MLKRLDEAGREGPPRALSEYFPSMRAVGHAQQLRCDNARVSDFMEPFDVLPRTE